MWMLFARIEILAVPSSADEDDEARLQSRNGRAESMMGARKIGWMGWKGRSIQLEAGLVMVQSWLQARLDGDEGLDWASSSASMTVEYVCVCMFLESQCRQG